VPASRARRWLGRLPRQLTECRAARRPAVWGRVQTAMVFDVGRPVARTIFRGDQEVGFTGPVPGRVGGQAPAEDQRDAVFHRGPRRILSLGSALAGDYACARMESEKVGNDFRLECEPAGKPPAQSRRRRQRNAWLDGVPLSADWALLGHITALRRHAGNVVARAHQSMLCPPRINRELG
jgi:hypothetical protein